MSLIPEYLTAAAQTQLATQFAAMHAFSQSAFAGMEKILALNFSTARQTLESTSAVARQFLAANDAQELLALGNAHGQPQMEKLLAYGRELAAISTRTREEFLQAVSGAEPDAAAATPTAPVAAKKASKAAAKPAVKPAAKPAVKASASPKQLPLLAEAELKTAKAPAKAAAKPASKAALPAADATAAPANAAPAPSAVPAAPEAAVTTIAAKVQPAAKSSGKTVSETVAETKPAAVAAPAKKSVVKFPFPAAPKLQNRKPGFPQADAKPAYKAKASAATGAKKRVRQ